MTSCPNGCNSALGDCNVCDPTEVATCTNAKMRHCLANGTGYEQQTCVNGCRSDGVPACLDCASTEHVCNNACMSKTSPQACGPSCAVCPSVPNAQSTCDGTACSFSCDPKTLRCTANGGHDYCQKQGFTFEGNVGTDGWRADVGFDNAAATGSSSVSTQRASSGTQSLAVPFTATATRDLLLIYSNPCGRGFATTQPETLDLRNRTLTAQLFLDSASAAASGAKCSLTAFGAACAGCDSSADVPLGKWTTLVSHLGPTDAPDTTYIGVQCQFTTSASFSGTAWLDDITIQ